MVDEGDLLVREVKKAVRQEEKIIKQQEEAVKIVRGEDGEKGDSRV